MSISDKINYIDVRIGLLRARGESLNYAIIRKLERKKRALQAKV